MYDTMGKSTNDHFQSILLFYPLWTVWMDAEWRAKSGKNKMRTVFDAFSVLCAYAVQLFFLSFYR